MRGFLHQNAPNLFILFVITFAVFLFSLPYWNIVLLVLAPSFFCYVFGLYRGSKDYVYHVALLYMLLVMLTLIIIFGFEHEFLALYSIVLIPLSGILFLVATLLFIVGRWLFKQSWKWVSVIYIFAFIFTYISIFELIKNLAIYLISFI